MRTSRGDKSMKVNGNVPRTPVRLSASKGNSRFQPLYSVFTMSILAACVTAGCGKKTPSAPPEQTAAKPAAPDSSLVSGEYGAAAPQGNLALPTALGKRTGDLDEMAKARVIRALVIVNPVGFF